MRILTKGLSVTSWFLLPTAAIALSQSVIIAQTPLSADSNSHQPFAIKKAAPFNTEPSSVTTPCLQANSKPGVPRRRVGGGSRLY